MIRFLTKSNKNNIVLFVHGLCGGEETWKNEDGRCFQELLLCHADVANHFDIATFDYFTSFFDTPSNVVNTIGWLKSLFKHSSNKNKKNVNVEEISELLRTQIRFKLNEYDNVIIVAHSMGGLISKNCIIKDITDHGHSKIKLLISLAVPHLGSDGATYGKLISSNIQLVDLAPLSELCPRMNEKWIKLSIKPDIKYFYGTYDEVVPKVSAVGVDASPKDVIACDDSHISICKPESEESTSVIAVRKFLSEFRDGSGESTLDLQKLESEKQFEDEYFVIKLLVADVHHATVTHSKEHFLNAEYARKLFSSAADQRKLSDLYAKIRSLYQDAYDKYLHNESMTSGQLVNLIHEKIVGEDDGYLRSALPLIHGLHKKGMLHQLANNLNEKIWWAEDQSIDTLEKFKKSVPKQ
ncbi:ABC-three component system protein [Duganella sp. Root1480D1]|uniref:ABC-three component system protein n=1 Tax=Duganella sp. Root1480D1 TaxID=1736471 RepID=UPI00070FC2DF|nr:ABC-three component system protein [Duganella sp. Root1480D1]KQZ45289.1 hypothetical protein ASD58_03365 [Duganella sp. Root1480D1]